MGEAIQPRRPRPPRAAGSEDDLPFRALAEDLPTPCWIAETSGEVIWVNKAWIAYTGMTVADIRRDTLEPLHDPKMFPLVRERWERARKLGEADDMEFPLRGRDGQLRPFHTHLAPVRDRQGRVVRWFGVNTDISDRANSEATLLTREEELREVFDRAGDSILVTDANARFIDVNPAACELFGYSREEFLRLHIYDVLDPDQAARARAVKGQTRDRAVSNLWRLRRKDGSWAEVEIISRILADGRQLGVARDVSERLRREADLRARADTAERNLRRFWDASRDLLAISSRADAVPTQINEHAWRDVLGYPPEEILGRRITRWVHPDDRLRSREVRARVGAGEAVFGYEDRYRRADGQWVWLSWNIVPEGDLVFSIARDVSAEKKRAEQAERAQRLESLGKLTGGVAHDFNNLLMTVLGALDLMQRRPDDRALHDRLTTAALAAVRRGERLNKQLLSFARAEPAGYDVTDVGALLADMRPLLDSALGEDVELAVDVARAPNGCALDAAQLEAAILNLVVNARDALPAGGKVSIRTRPVLGDERERHGLAGPHDYLVLEVSDNGEGMSRDVLAHAFEPFFTTKPMGQGSGLGLSQVYGAARQAGGLATVESEPNAGTTVRMYLRAAEVEAAAAAAAAPRPDEGERVLLVEDDVLVGVVTESLLDDAGYRVTRACDAVEALAALRDGAFDILVTDVRMPGEMNGVDLAREATRRNPRLRVLLCSGWAPEGLGSTVSEAPWPLLAKPFDEARLRRALDALKALPEPAK